MKKRMFFMLLFVAILFGGIFGYKYIKGREQKAQEKAAEVVVSTVSAMSVTEEEWQSRLKVTGSLRTVKGVRVTTELGGMIRDIYFKPGSYVTKGELLVRLDIDPDVAKLHELTANAAIATITFHRNQKQYEIGAVSKETLDIDEANYKATAALVSEQEGTIAKKVIRAPFSGRLGVSEVNPGQFLNPGDAIVTLETIDPIYADFYLPQQDLPHLVAGKDVSVTMDAYPKKIFEGIITTINPIVDRSIRNIKVEATLPNVKRELLPGMFVSVSIKTGEPQQRVTLPQMAISFNPYGSIVYVLTKTNKTHEGKAVWKAGQKFVKVGETRLTAW